jgi:hypothetical protein
LRKSSLAKAIDSSGGGTVGRENAEMWDAFLSNWRDHNNAFWLCMSGNLDRISLLGRKVRFIASDCDASLSLRVCR